MNIRFTDLRGKFRSRFEGGTSRRFFELIRVGSDELACACTGVFRGNGGVCVDCAGILVWHCSFSEWMG